MAEAVPIPAGIEDDGGEIVPINVPTHSPDFALTQLFVAAINSKGNLVYTNQTKPNGPFNSKWTAIGKGTYDVLAAGTTLDGRVAIVATDAATHSVQYIAETKAGGKGKNRWEAPEDLGAPAKAAPFNQLVLARGVDGLDNVFGITPENNDRSIWWKYRNPPVIVTKKEKVIPPGSKKPITVEVQVTEPPAKPWSEWINLNNNLPGGMKSLYATNNADGRILLGGAYFNYLPWVCQQKSDAPFKAEQWTEWTLAGGTPAETTGALTPVLDNEGYVSVFASTNDGILRSRQTQPGGDKWGGWSAPGQIFDNVANHACNIDAHGHIYVATLNFPAKGTKTLVYGAMQTDTAHAQWTSWQLINMIYSANQVALDYNADGSLTLFAFDSDSEKLSALTQVAPDSTEWYYEWVDLGSGLKSFAVTRDLTPN